MKKFRTWYDTKIEEVEVIKDTGKTVTYANGDRHPVTTKDYYRHFSTWQEAKDFLIDRENTAIKALCDEIDKHETTLAKIMEMHQ